MIWYHLPSLVIKSSNYQPSSPLLTFLPPYLPPRSSIALPIFFRSDYLIPGTGEPCRMKPHQTHHVKQLDPRESRCRVQPETTGRPAQNQLTRPPANRPSQYRYKSSRRFLVDLYDPLQAEVQRQDCLEGVILWSKCRDLHLKEHNISSSFNEASYYRSQNKPAHSSIT